MKEYPSIEEMYFGETEWGHGDLNPEEHRKFSKLVARTRQKAKELGATHLVIFVCQDMCSSHLGEHKALLIGPDCTYKTVEELEGKSIDNELASTAKLATGFAPIGGEDG